jgi:preprotein translocase subunit YajC
MLGEIWSLGLVFAQAAPAAAKANEGALPSWSIFAIQIAPILILGYLLFGLPMRQQKKRLESLNALKKNDRVVTESGIYGTIVSVDPDADKMVLRIDDEKGVKITCRKSSVARIESATGSTPSKAKSPAAASTAAEQGEA